MIHIQAFYYTDQVNGSECIRTTCTDISKIKIRKGEGMVYHFDWISDIVDFIYTKHGWALVPF